MSKIDKDIADRFFTMMAMAGAKEGVRGRYMIEKEGRLIRFTAKTQKVGPETIEALGGSKLRALKLLRHAEAAVYICSEDKERFGVISQSLFAVAARWPLLRSYYERCKIGSAAHTYAKWGWEPE